MEACGMSSPKESANQRTASLFGRPSYKSLTLPLQELATLFSQPLTSTKPEPMEQATPSPPSEQPSSVHVEICQAPMSTLRASQMHELVRGYLMRAGALRDSVDTEFSDTVLSEHVISITITDVPTDKYIDPSSPHIRLHVYKLHDDGPSTEELEEESNVSSATHWMLPATEFHGLWESLVYDMDIKPKLLRYVETTLLFSDREVNSSIISWNRVVLLYGPPGTGKTSLCKALAQKLCIRLSRRYSYGQLVEINSHSLFSKWFSESGKLVQKMFAKITELIEDPDALVCVLIDEVESLTASRKASMSGAEPSDAIRVVNALLTQLDQIRRYPNVIILTTSNITGAIDLAFVDRADIKQYIGYPSPAAVFKIYHSCVLELMRVGIVTPRRDVIELRENGVTFYTQRLKLIACKSEGLSGRTLRKLPFLALSTTPHTAAIALQGFLSALDSTVDTQLGDREELARQ
ncbi:pachytene checkpoint protein 2 homolog isoform X2 [Halichondria panicea]|uniref:pachytene checkpoint protein 2 homolog isoform X2 n=1 Tax=Halichondria panicea TaxID=6063 RepID=UPI00312BB0D1